MLNDLANLSDRIGSYRDPALRDGLLLLEDDNSLGKFDHFKKDYADIKAYINKKIEEETKFAKEFLSNPENKKNLDAIAKALGIEPGELMTFFEADQLRCNPNYRADEIYRINCQTCVVADELRRRGLNVQALGNTEGSWLEKLSHSTNQIWLDENGKIPQKIRIGAVPLYRTNPITGERYVYKFEKTVANRKQLITELESSLTEDGRYHINWSWNGQSKKYIKGHIITVERIDGVLRYYDPQNGRVIDNFHDYIKDIKLNRGISVLRVDNLRVNHIWVDKIFTKAGASAESGKITREGILGGITPKLDKEGFKLLQKEVKQSAEGYSKEIIHNKNIFYTHRMVLNRESLRSMVGHAYTEDELRAIMKLPKYIGDISNPKYDPLKLSRLNIRQKINDGVKHFVEYEIEINGKEYILKTKAVTQRHGKYLLEYPYSFREK